MTRQKPVLYLFHPLTCFGLTRSLGFYQDIFQTCVVLETPNYKFMHLSNFFDAYVIYANADGYVFFYIYIRGIKAALKLLLFFSWRKYHTFQLKDISAWSKFRFFFLECLHCLSAID